MKVVIELQDAFCNHYSDDKFEDSLNRILWDIEFEFTNYYTISGNYEIELLREFLRAFPKSYQIDGKSGAKMENEK